MSTKRTERETSKEKNGRYSHGLETVCKLCGQTKGEHDAEKPFAQDDAARGFTCEGFQAPLRLPKELPAESLLKAAELYYKYK